MEPSPSATKAMVAIRHVSQKNGRRGQSAVLVDVDLEIQRGECFAVMGPHGAGKTVLAELVAGMRLPTLGTVLVEEIDTRHNLPPIATFVAYLSQHAAMPEHVTVQQQLFFAGVLRGMPTDESRQAARDLMERADLLLLAKRPVRLLTAGQRQLTRFCATLMGYPRLIVLDEPSTGLDPIQRRWVWDILRVLHRQTSVTLLICSHDLDGIDRVADRAAYLRAGKITALGTPALLKEHYGSGPRLDVRLTPGITLDDRARAGLSRLGTLEETEDLAGFVLYPSAETIGQLARSVPMPVAAPVPTPKKGRGRGRAQAAPGATAVADPENESWLLDRQTPVPGTLGRTIEAIFAIVGPDHVAECWFAPPALHDVYARLGGSESA